VQTPMSETISFMNNVLMEGYGGGGRGGRRLHLVIGKAWERDHIVCSFCHSKVLSHGVCGVDSCAALAPGPHPSLRFPNHKSQGEFHTFEVSQMEDKYLATG